MSRIEIVTTTKIALALCRELESAEGLVTMRDAEAKAARYQAGCLGWLPYDIDRWHYLMGIAAGSLGGAHYLELGSGIGTKLLMAGLHGFRATGIEIDPLYCERSRRIAPLATVIELDVRGLDPLPHADVTFINHPLAGEQEEAELEKRLVTGMRPGSFLLIAHATTELAGAHWETYGTAEGAVLLRKAG